MRGYPNRGIEGYLKIKINDLAENPISICVVSFIAAAYDDKEVRDVFRHIAVF